MRLDLPGNSACFRSKASISSRFTSLCGCRLRVIKTLLHFAGAIPDVMIGELGLRSSCLK